MALNVRYQGGWRNTAALYVRSGGAWKTVQYLFVKTGEKTTWPNTPPQQGDVPTITPIWKVARSFVGPTAVPGIPALVNWNPADGPPPKDIPLPMTVYVNMSAMGSDPVWRSWEREIRFLLDGYEVGTAVINDPDQTQYREVWYRGSGSLRVQVRYRNEAGVSNWSGLSSTVQVR